VPIELSNLVALACVWGTFGVAEWLQSEAGIMAAVIMGLVAQNAAIPGTRQLRHFKEALTTLGISVLFILLSADLELSTLWKEGAAGILAVFLIMFAARPLAVFLSTWRANLNWRQKAFIAWVGPRGIIAASVASIFMIALEESGLEGGERLLALTFLTILMTVSIQGLTAGWVAGALGLRDMGKQKALVVGANGLGCAITRLLNKYDRPALLIDTNLTSVERARQKGMDAAPGNALEEGVLEELHAEEYATFLAVTSNSEVNVLACQLAHDGFGIDRAFPALSNPAKGANPALLKQTGGKLAFGRFITVANWEKAEAEIHELSWLFPLGRAAANARDISLLADLIPILRIRNGSAEIVHAEQSWQPGDTIIILSLLAPSEAQSALDQV
jgi:peroxiredoxin family protein